MSKIPFELDLKKNNISHLKVWVPLKDREKEREKEGGIGRQREGGRDREKGAGT